MFDGTDRPITLLRVAAYGLFHKSDVPIFDMTVLDENSRRIWRKDMADDLLWKMAAAIDDALSKSEPLAGILPDLNHTEEEVRAYLRVVRRTIDHVLLMPKAAAR